MPLTLADADAHLLHSLFSPRSVLLCGASRDAGRIGGKVLQRLGVSGYAGRVEVLSEHETVQGVKARRDVVGMEPVDLAVITLPAAVTLGTVEMLAETAAAKAILVSSSGFADAGDVDAQNRLVEVCRAAGITLVGPNALGTFSTSSQFVSTFATQLDRTGALPLPDGDVAIVSESGAVAAFIHAGLQDAAIGVRHWAALGNAATTSVADVLRCYAGDEAVGTVIVYVEAVADVEPLLAGIAACTATGQRVLFLTSGESQVGQRAAASHTGRFASDYRLTRALARGAGATLVDSIEHAVDVTKVRALGGGGRGGWVIGTISGGAGVEAADHAARVGLPLAELSAATRERLRAALPTFASVENPVDVTAQVVNEPGLVATATEILRGDPDVTGVLWVLGLQEASGEGIAQQLLEAMADDPRVAVAWLSPPRAAVQTLQGSALPVFDSIVRMIDAVSAVSAAARAEGDAGPGGADPSVVAEDVAKGWLQDAGLAIPTLAPALGDGQEAILKVAGPYLIHKRKAGLMAGPVESDAERDVVAGMLLRRARTLGLTEARVFSEQWAQPPQREWFVSLVDGGRGPVVLIGSGGTDVEELDDVGAIVPADLAQTVPTLGFVDPGQALATLEALLTVFAQQGLALLEVNPLGEYPDGALRCLDAVARRSAPAESAATA